MAVLSNVDIIERLLAAAAFGSLIGFERERLLWAAGIRTHMLVCVGACLFMIVSAFGFSLSLSQEHVVLDPSRVAAQVVSGIGFLGAGAILARGEIVRGLHAKQRFGTHAKGLFEPDRHFRRQTGAAVEEIAHGLPGHAELRRRLGYVQPVRLDELSPEPLARVNGKAPV